ncbi:alpha/beta hydrolase [uncultured Sneathiella sp.]|uniref:alpha/beta fold hydrolase n=1 Tax=uncultured Sneathiella sp. TaxID=879315 RepID=UPI0030D9666D
MANMICNGLSLEYEAFGDADKPAVFLIAGLGFQLIDWPVAFCESVAAEGFHVIRFDNRDIGLSQKLNEKGIPDLGRIMQQLQNGEVPAVPYHLSQMAADLAALMEGLSIHQAHIIGMSMGGMIAQLMAIFYPEKVLSLTSIMSSSGNRQLPPSTPAATSVLMSAPASQDVEDVVDFGLKVNDVIGSPGHRWERSYSYLCDKELFTGRIYAPICCGACLEPAGVGVAGRHGANPRDSWKRRSASAAGSGHGHGATDSGCEAGTGCGNGA